MGTDYFLDGALRSRLPGYMQPIVANSHTLGSSLFKSDFWQSRAELQETIARLSDEVERAKASAAALEMLQSENEILRLLARLAANTNGVTVPVISSFSSSPYGTFMIGGGQSAGIAVGDLALAGDGYVLGEVTDDSLNSAVVSAVFAPGAVTDVMTSDAAFAVRGRGGGNARAEVPRELPLTVGAPLLAPRFASRPVGVIGRIESASSSAFSDVFVLFPYNITVIRFVFVTPR